MLRAGLLKTSLTNYPGRLAAAVFLPGCNLRCPYCYNRELALSDPAEGPAADSDEEYFSEADIFSHLEKRASVLGALAVSGGEPLLSPFLEPLIRKAKSLHLAVKIDTNGTLPDRLYRLLENEALRPDMVAMDIKTSRKNIPCLHQAAGIQRAGKLSGPSGFCADSRRKICAQRNTGPYWFRDSRILPISGKLPLYFLKMQTGSWLFFLPAAV